MLIEASIAIALIVVIAHYAFSSIEATMRTTGFSIHAQILDNYLANQAAAVRSVPVAQNGALTMPSFAGVAFSTTPGQALTFANRVLNGSSTAHTGTIVTTMRASTAVNGQQTWEYIVEGSIPRRLPGTTAVTSYTKSVSVVRSVPPN